MAPVFIEPGSPWENGLIESFHGKLRGECLNEEIFWSGREAQVAMDWDREVYNQSRPHSSLGYKTPNELAGGRSGPFPAPPTAEDLRIGLPADPISPTLEMTAFVGALARRRMSEFPAWLSGSRDGVQTIDLPGSPRLAKVLNLRIVRPVGFILLALVAIFALRTRDAAATTLPPNFADEQVAAGFQRPVDLAVDPSGRLFVAEKHGIVWIVENGARLWPPFINLVPEVHNAGDKGMLGIELDPNFQQNGYVYLLYSVDPTYGQPDEDEHAVTFSRLTRYTIGPDNTAIPASRHVILGNSYQDGFPGGSQSHSIGSLRFGPDGALFVGAGDGANPDYVDGGQDVTEYDPEFAAIWGPEEDIGALRAQRLDSLDGKILRINPETGQGMPDNPFFEPMAPESNRSKVWAYGLRNPFRFAVRPNSIPQGTLYIGDVGWNRYEEINVSQTGGENFGWPCFEGRFSDPLYTTDPLTAPTCQGVGAPQVKLPLFSWHHRDAGSIGFTGNCVSGVAFYTGTQFPPEFWGNCFIADYGENWIRAVKLDANDNRISITPFASGLDAVVDLEFEPATGGLLYIQAFTNEVRRIRYSADNLPPIVSVSSTPDGGLAPLSVQFSCDGTFDPNGDPLTFVWDFGDGFTSPVPNPVHQYATGGIHTVTLTARDDRGAESSRSLTVQSMNQPPTVEIISPADGYIFTPQERVEFHAQGTDLEDGANLAYYWEILLVHNNHLHPDVFNYDGKDTPPVQLSGHGVLADRYSYLATVTVTDGGGLTASKTIRLIPSNLGGNQPPNAAIEATPLEGGSALLVGFNAEGASDPDGDLMTYAWDFGDGLGSTGIGTTHVYVVPGAYTATLTATDVTGAAGTASTSVFVFGPAPRAEYFDDPALSQPHLARSEEPIDFDWGAGPPGQGIPSDAFSVRWTGVFVPQFSETYDFTIQCDDKVRLWINERILIDHWADGPAGQHSAPIYLRAGEASGFRLEYSDTSGGAEVQLSWSSPSQPMQVIPPSRLFAPFPPGYVPPTNGLSVASDWSLYD